MTVCGARPAGRVREAWGLPIQGRRGRPGRRSCRALIPGVRMDPVGLRVPAATAPRAEDHRRWCEPARSRTMTAAPGLVVRPGRARADLGFLRVRARA